MSRDDEDGDDEKMGMAAIAVHSKSSSSTSSLFESPNENKPITHQCLMDREVTTKSTSTKPPNPNSSCEEL